MKKVLATLVTLCGMAAYVNAQGTFIVDSGANGGNGSLPTANSGGLVWLNPTGSNPVLDTDTDINLQVLWGTTAGGVTNILNMDLGNANSPANPNWLASQATGSSDITFNANGSIIDPNGYSYNPGGLAAGTTVFLELTGWTGSAADPTLAGGSDLLGSTSVFSIVLAANTNPIQPDVHGMSALVLDPIPEPSTFALAGLGAAALLIFRRRK